MNKKKFMRFVLVGLLSCVFLFVSAAESVNFGKRTKALYANEALDYEDAICWGMLMASNYNSDYYDFLVEIHTKAEFTKLPKDLFEDSWEALITQKYGLTMIDCKDINDYEEISVIRLKDGKFVVISVEATEKTKD